MFIDTFTIQSPSEDENRHKVVNKYSMKEFKVDHINVVVSVSDETYKHTIHMTHCKM